VEFARLNYDFHPKAVMGWLEQGSFHLERQLTVSHYRIPLLKRLIPVKVLIAADAMTQLTGDLWQLTPSVFTRSRAMGETPLASPGAFFRCPGCKEEALKELPGQVECLGCGKSWPVQDGIYDFRLRNNDG